MSIGGPAIKEGFHSFEYTTVASGYLKYSGGLKNDLKQHWLPSSTHIHTSKTA